MDDEQHRDTDDTQNKDQTASSPVEGTQEEPLVRDHTGGQDVAPDNVTREGEQVGDARERTDATDSAGSPPDSAAEPAATSGDGNDATTQRPAPGAGTSQL